MEHALSTTRADVLVPLSPNQEVVMELALPLWCLIAALAYMVGGPKLAKKVFSAPVKIVGKLLTDMASAVLKFSFDLLAKVLRALGRAINRGARRLLGLSPPPPPQRRRRRLRSESDEDEDEDDAEAAA